MNKYNIHESYLFEGVDENYIDEFLSSCEIIKVNKGEFLFHQNELGDNMYIVENGKLEVMLDEKHSIAKNIVGTLASGSIIGELCVFGQKKRSASIYAIEDSTLYKIEGEDFRARIYSKEFDALLMCYNIAKVLSERLITTDVLFVNHD